MERAAAEAERRRELARAGPVAASRRRGRRARAGQARETAARTRHALARGRDAGDRGRGRARAGRAAAAGPGRDAGAALGHPLRGRQALVAGGAARPRALLHRRASATRCRSARWARPRCTTGSGFDHRNALDVAVHPDSPEGRALMDYLRAHGIPFLAFRAARRGRGHRRPRARRRAERPPVLGCESPDARRPDPAPAGGSTSVADRLGRARRRDRRAAAPLPDDRHHQPAGQRDRRGRAFLAEVLAADDIAERDRGVGARARQPRRPAGRRRLAGRHRAPPPHRRGLRRPPLLDGRSRSAASSRTATSTAAARST